MKNEWEILYTIAMMKWIWKWSNRRLCCNDKVIVVTSRDSAKPNQWKTESEFVMSIRSNQSVYEWNELVHPLINRIFGLKFCINFVRKIIEWSTLPCYLWLNLCLFWKRAIIVCQYNFYFFCHNIHMIDHRFIIQKFFTMFKYIQFYFTNLSETKML